MAGEQPRQQTRLRVAAVVVAEQTTAQEALVIKATTVGKPDPAPLSRQPVVVLVVSVVTGKVVDR